MDKNESKPRSIGIWMGSLVSSVQHLSQEEAEARAAKNDAIIALLGKLSIHFWRPDFTAAQARQLYVDYVYDLGDYSLRDIADAIVKYRQGGHEFFPKSGQLVQIIRAIPSWDIRTQKEHADILRADARKELEDVTKRLVEGRKMIGKSPEGVA